MKKTFLLILAVFLIASVLRFYQLGKTPIGLEWDEVAIGYDAYSVLKTGKDQFGAFLPLTFRSLDDYKPPIYEYAAIPPIAIFGLNAFSVRFPSAFFGTLSVLAVFFLGLQIFSEIPVLKDFKFSTSFLASFLLAISPWHLQFSRAAFEVNLSVFITICAVLFFLKGLKDYKYFLISAVFFGLNFFSYHSARVVSPLLLVALLVIFNKKLPPRKQILGFLITLGLFFLLFIPVLFSPGTVMRFSATNIFTPGARYLDEKDLEKIFLDMRLRDKLAGFEQAGIIFHNQRLIYTDYDTLVKAFNHYLSNFGFEFLFVTGDAPLHHAPGFGLAYIWELPFIIIGLILFLTKGRNRYSLIIPLWLLLAPVPDAVTREAPHAVRTEIILPTLQILAAAGIIFAVNIVRKESKWVYLSFIVFLTGFMTLNHSYYLHQYYVSTNYDLSRNWLYGRKEAVEYTEEFKNKYDRVLVSLSVDQPLDFWLFYSSYSPSKYLAGGGTVSGGFAVEDNHFDKYQFRNFNYRLLPDTERILLVGTPRDFPPEAKILKRIYYLDGTPALDIAEN